MRTQPRVLQLFDRHAQEGRLVTLKDVARELDITDQASADTLERLWRQRLIAAVSVRPPGFKWRRAPDERVRDLRFRLASRGKERLRWWVEKRRGKGGDWWIALTGADR